MKVEILKSSYNGMLAVSIDDIRHGPDAGPWTTIAGPWELDFRIFESLQAANNELVEKLETSQHNLKLLHENNAEECARTEVAESRADSLQQQLDKYSKAVAKLLKWNGSPASTTEEGDLIYDELEALTTTPENTEGDK